MESKLTITIPSDDIISVEDRILLYKKALAYLETPACRQIMSEAMRRRAVKEATENFKAALRMKDGQFRPIEYDPLYL